MKAKLLPQSELSLVSYTSFPNFFLLIALSFDAVQSELTAVTSKKSQIISISSVYRNVNHRDYCFLTEKTTPYGTTSVHVLLNTFNNKKLISLMRIF